MCTRDGARLSAGEIQLTWATCCPGKGWGTWAEGLLSSKLGMGSPEHSMINQGRRAGEEKQRTCWNWPPLLREPQDSR